MHAEPDLATRLLRACVRRRLPLWLAAAVPCCLLLSLPGLLAWAVWAGWDYWRLRARVLRDWASWLDGAIAALEDSSALLVHAATPVARLQQRRLLQRLDGALDEAELRRVAQSRMRPGYPWLAASAAAALALLGWQMSYPGDPLVAAFKARLGAPKSALLLHVAPPRYTGAANSDSAPRDLQVPEQSEVQWCLAVPQAGVETIELSDGRTLTVGRECARWSALESMFWRWRGVRYKLLVLPDQAPEITVSKPGEMIQVLAPDARNAAIAVAVHDDYMVRRATLHLTLARGSGENIRFSDREMPLPESSDPRQRNWSKQWSLAELGMEPGDELYFFVRASDNAGRPHLAQSPTYTLRLPGPVAADDTSSALPILVKPENLRSQRQIIIDTEQLLADLKANPRLATLRARSESIAGDQAQLRRRYGQFLGEESSLFGGDEHDHDEGQSRDMVAQFGHMHDQAENATLFDEATKKVLRRALGAMWDAERALRAITPQPALAPEYKALEAIKELQQADRIYLHKTAFVPPAIKEEKRLSGDVLGSASFKREQGGVAELVPAELRSLLAALESEQALPALWSRQAQELVRAHIGADEQRLAAQRAIQDVADGCGACRPVLRAWLRSAVTQAPVLLQAAPVVDTPFAKAWRKGVQP
ncbi:MAG: hypothetical protein V4508_08520 [Pseudomonadota bacterium]